MKTMRVVGLVGVVMVVGLLSIGCADSSHQVRYQITREQGGVVEVVGDHYIIERGGCVSVHRSIGYGSGCQPVAMVCGGVNTITMVNNGGNQ